MGLTNREWRNLIKDINSNRCILMLGPKLATVDIKGQNLPMLEVLSESLSSELEEEAISYELSSKNNLPYIAQRFMSIPKIRRMDLEDEVLQFYEQHTGLIPNLYQALAKLPFHLVVNTTPDDFMHKALKSVGKWESQMLHYNFKKEQLSSIPHFSSDAPLVYNLLGSLSDPESLVINEEDQVEFIKNVVKGNPPIPNQIMRHFDERKTYLFLGFDLEEWHFRLLLDSLKLDVENMTISPQTDNYPLSAITQTFYEDRYRFVFVEERISDFVSSLINAYQESQTNGAKNTTVKRLVILHDGNEQDTDCRNKLVDHLSVLKQKGNLDIWHLGLTDYGEVDAQLTQRMAQVDLILPILSADFFASDLISQRELLLIRENLKRTGTKLMSVLNRACNFEDSELSQYPVLPAKDKPIQSWSNPDEAYKLIVEQIKQALYE